MSIEDAVQNLMVALQELDPNCKEITLMLPRAAYEKYNQAFIPNIPDHPSKDFRIEFLMVDAGQVKIEIEDGQN